MTNTDRFLNAYNKIDEFLRKEGYDKQASFTHIVKNSKNPNVKHFRDKLISFGELRNAIVHSPRFDKYQPIAEPYISTVDDIEDLHSKITRPKSVVPIFQFDVLGAREEDFINDILLKMKQNSFSQFPVFDQNGFVLELINTNTISRWLCSELEDHGTIITEKIRIKNLLPEIEYTKNYGFISRNASIYEAYEIFIKQINKTNRNLDVIFITHSGKTNEKLLGLITIEDIANQV